MTEQHILTALTYIDSKYIDSAQKKLGYLPQEQPIPVHHRGVTLRRVFALVAAVMIVTSVLFLTAMGVSGDFREFVFSFFRVEELSVIPEWEKTDTDQMAVEPERANIGGVVEATYVHTPRQSYARNGVFLICTDEKMMNSGNHYDAYKEKNGELIKLEKHFFSETYTVLGKTVTIEFEWAEHNGYAVFTYVDSDAPFFTMNMAGGVNNTLIHLRSMGQVGGYPVVIDLETGAMRDILAGTGAEQLVDIEQAALSEDGAKMLLALWDGSIYYVDLTQKQLYSVDALSGERVDECSLIGNTLTCWTLEGASIEEAELGFYRVWSIDLTTLERKELFTLPATPAESHDVWSLNQGDIRYDNAGNLIDDGERQIGSEVGLHFIEGFSRTFHWGNMYTGTKFAVLVDANRDVYVLDLSDGEKSQIPGYKWPQISYPYIECSPSPDGKKLMIKSRSANNLDTLGVIDFDRKAYFEFSRANENDVSEYSVYWFDNESIIVCAELSDALSDYYVYKLLK